MSPETATLLEAMQERWIAAREHKRSLQAARNAQAQTVAWARLAMERTSDFVFAFPATDGR